MKIGNILLLSIAILSLLAPAAYGQEGGESDLAKKTQNPVSDLISLPFQNNTNFGIGPHDRTQNVLNIQPVIPFSLSEKWNIITRTIVPYIYQPDITKNSGGELGIGDINTTLFLSPASPGKIIWGAGPIFSFPTTTNEKLGTEKWCIGPSAVALTMHGPWVAGVLINNVWSFAGRSDRANVNQMLIQYFINYNLKKGWYLSSAPIITANWKADGDDTWLVPFGGGVGKVFKIGKQPMNASVQAFYNAIHPDDAPYPNWTLRLQLQFLFPK